MNTSFCLDEIINGMTTLNILTLERAAEISPLVTECTLGPEQHPKKHESKSKRFEKDECELTAENKTLNANADVLKAANMLLSRSPACEQGSKKNFGNSHALNPSTCTTEVSHSSLQNLDYDTINSSLLLREAEQQRRHSVRKELLENQEKHKANAMSSMDQAQQLQDEHDKWLAHKQLSDTQLLHEAEQQTARQLQEQNRQIEGLRKNAHQQMQQICFKAIVQSQKKFRIKYENVVTTLISIDKQKLISCEEYNRKLTGLVQMFDQLSVKLKGNDFGTQELKAMEKLYRSLEGLEESIITELENIVKREKVKAEVLREEERKQREEQSKQVVDGNAQATHLQLQVEPQAQSLQQEHVAGPAVNTESAPENVTQANVTVEKATPGSVLPKEASAQYVSPACFQFYTQIIAIYQEKVDKVKPLQTDESMKKFRFACQRVINTPVNAISAVSAQHLQDKFEKLYNFISGQPTRTTDGQISITDHPLGRDYCILLMAKKFVSQGDTAISSNPQAAFPVASVIVALWKLVPDFGTIFLAYVYKESPFLVPYFIPQKRGQPVEEYYKVLGYRIIDGQLEAQDMYLKRQAGICRLYAAVMITNGRQRDGPEHPYDIEHGWCWLTNFINLEPLPDICATLVLEFLQIVCSKMYAVYGRQLVKLLFSIHQYYFPKLSAVDEGGPKARLELLLQKILKEGQITNPQGLLPAGFW